MLKCARRIWKLTAGLIDPTIGQALKAAGYDVSFEEITQNKPAGWSAEVQITDVTFEDVLIDFDNKYIILPRGCSLDFGGLGKGYLVD